LDYLRTGDTLLVWRLDRLGRGLKRLIESIDGLHARRLQFTSSAALAEWRASVVGDRGEAGRRRGDARVRRRP
jgi:hypothetical protein